MGGKPVVVKVSDGQWVGLSLPLLHVKIKAVKKRIKRSQVEAGN